MRTNEVYKEVRGTHYTYMNNIDPITNYIVSGNQLVDMRCAIGSLIRRLETDMFLYNFAKGGDTDTTIRELKQLLNDTEYNKIRMDVLLSELSFNK